MSYNLKTLIVFDSNSLRDTPDGKPAYTSFAFGAPFRRVREFVDTNGLVENVKLGVPSMVLDELKQQKRKQYQKDLQQLKEIQKRMKGLPLDVEIAIDPLEDDFNCEVHVNTRAQEYLDTHPVTIISFKEDDAVSMLKSMLIKVLDVEAVQSPFRPKDAGFKDNVIWETLMHFDGLAEFDKIIFLTKDGDFKENCYSDFNVKWHKHLQIFRDESLVIAELESDYGNYIQNRKIYEYALTEYFDGYLGDLLTPKTYVEVEGENLKIENFSIANHCARVKMEADQEGDFVRPVIFSHVVINTTSNGEKIEVPVTARTVLSDAEAMEISETEFEPNIS